MRPENRRHPQILLRRRKLQTIALRQIKGRLPGVEYATAWSQDGNQLSSLYPVLTPCPAIWNVDKERIQWRHKMRSFPLLQPQRVFLWASLAAVLASSAPQSLAQTQDQLTPAVKSALADQWNTPAGTQICIHALEVFGSGKKDDALKVLKTGLPEDIQQTYAIAADVLGAEFWRLVAASHPPVPPFVLDCSDAAAKISTQFGANRKSLYDSAKLFRAKGPYAGFAALLNGQPDAAVRRTYRGCFDVDPAQLLGDIEKTLGIER
jgi:hypothetical protein